MNNDSSFISKYTVDFSDCIDNQGTVLGIQIKGGSGHILAMEAIQEQFSFVSDPKLFKVCDVIEHSFPIFVGRVMSYLLSFQWNQAKRKGDIAKQENLLKGEILGIPKVIMVDYLLFIPVFLSFFFRIALDRKIIRVIDTQPLATFAITKAVRANNFLFNRSIKVTKVITDMPTKGAIHYAIPISSLNAKDKAVLEVVATNPLKLDETESDKGWWKRVFGLHFDPIDSATSQVKYRQLPVRAPFANVGDEIPKKLEVRVNNSEEFILLQQLLGRKLEGKKKVSIQIDSKKDLIGLVTLGSQASVKTKQYAFDFLETARALPKNRKYFLFLACGRHKEGKNSLFKELSLELLQKNRPSNVFILPLGLQGGKEMAQLMRSFNFGVGSAGGLTLMELLKVAKGKLFIHSEMSLAKEEDLDSPFKQIVKNSIQIGLLKGLPLWEEWNAVYAIKEVGAEVVIPGEVFRSAFSSYAQSSSESSDDKVL